ncbi:hypothetical protein ACP70R_047717 [Stipagrostis hirtigluma subsp. patula]
MNPSKIPEGQEDVLQQYSEEVAPLLTLCAILLLSFWIDLKNACKIEIEVTSLYMWPCAWACTPQRHRYLLDKVAESCPEAIVYLQTFHKQIWSRAEFSGVCKVDYVNNNISECFNNWIKDYKDVPVDILMDTIRGKIMEKIATRQLIASKLTGH